VLTFIDFKDFLSEKFSSVTSLSFSSILTDSISKFVLSPLEADIFTLAVRIESYFSTL
jgi:hypothetical protein